MRAAAVEVGLDVAQVDVEQSERLRAVDERQDAAVARELADLFRGEHVADRAGEVREPDHFRVRRDRACERVDVVLRAWMRIRRRNLLHGEAEALRLLLPRRVVARVVVGGDDHFVAGFQIDAVRHEVVRLARVARDHDLFRRHAQELREQLPRVLAPLAELHAIVERGIAIHVLRRVVQRVEHGRGRGTQVRRIQHRQLLGHDELIADRRPELLVGRRRRRRKIGRPRPGGSGREKWCRAPDGKKPCEFSAVHSASCGTFYATR